MVRRRNGTGKRSKGGLWADLVTICKTKKSLLLPLTFSFWPSLALSVGITLIYLKFECEFIQVGGAGGGGGGE